MICYEAGQVPQVFFPVFLTQSNKIDFLDHYYFYYFLNTALAWGIWLKVSNLGRGDFRSSQSMVEIR